MSMTGNKYSDLSSPEGENLFLVKSPLLNKYHQIIHAFSTRKGGFSHEPFDSLNLSTKTGDRKTSVNENVDRLKNHLSIQSPFIFLNQIHGDKILAIEDLNNNGGPYDFDAVITSKKNIPLIILTADCLPLLLYDPVKSVIAAIHAGWKGTSLQIVKKTVCKMKEEFKSNPAHIIAAMGPAIGPCCYEVDHPVIEAFEKIDDYTPDLLASFISPLKEKKDRWILNLARANRLQLLNVGLIKDNICEEQYCTCCKSDLFYSYRRDGKDSGRQGAVIMIKDA